MPSIVRRSASIALFALIVVACTQCGGPSGPVDGGKAMAHVKAQVAFGSRPFGSEALGKTTDYLEGELKKLGLAPLRHEVMHEKEKKLIRNLYVQIDGDDPKAGPVLVLGAHYDTKIYAGCAEWKHSGPFLGAIDGGGAPAVLLELARVLKERTPKPKCNVWLYFIDAEESITWEWNDEKALLGSQAFCQMLSDTKQLSRIKAFVLLDLIGSKDWKIDRDGNSDSKLQALFATAAKEMGESSRVYEFPTAQELEYYTGQGIKWGTKDDHNMFTRFGVPSVLLIDFARRVPPHLQNLKPGQAAQIDPRFQQWWHTDEDDLAAMDSDALAFTGNLVMQAFPALENRVLGNK